MSVEVDNKETQQPERDSRGWFLPKNQIARKAKGVRNKIIQQQLAYINQKIDEGYAYYEAIHKMAHDPNISDELRLKALKIENDFINNPNLMVAISEESENLSGADLKSAIFAMLEQGKEALKKEPLFNNIAILYQLRGL